MHWEPDVGFNPGSPGSRPGPKAGAKPLRHPGIPSLLFVKELKVPVKEKKLMEVKLGELPGWILMRDFTPKGIAGAFQRGQSLQAYVNQSKCLGYYRYYNKYINVKKGGVAGISMVLAAYVLFNYCRSYKELTCVMVHLALACHGWKEAGWSLAHQSSPL
uniref:ATP synthase F(0) complex subunit f, mitochondrial n=1 Tax=Canis lupus familiaris TaxID=9615 RepID=A0A8C0QNI9_CANLF